MTRPDLRLRPLTPADLPDMWRWTYGEPDPPWKRWDAPYWPLGHVTREQFVERMSARLDGAWRVIEIAGTLAGVVSRHWEDEQGGWLEVGIVIYDPARWSGGYGTGALRRWTALCFQETPAHLITLSTWGGNARMLRAGEKAGYRECARVREARLWQGQRWDSVRMQVLRGEWADAG